MNNNGFTFIELLITVGIIAVVASFSLSFFGSWQISLGILNYKAQIIENIELARLKSMVSENNKEHGIYFNLDSFVLFQGESYVSRDDDYDRIFNLSNNLSLNTNLDNNEIIFNKYTGQPDISGTISLSDKNSDRNYQIMINQFGFVTEN